jgi:hypothetical protein
MAVVAGNAAISVVDVLPRKRVHVGDTEMSYIDTGGQGNPIVFLSTAIRRGRTFGVISFPLSRSSVGVSRRTLLEWVNRRRRRDGLTALSTTLVI